MVIKVDDRVCACCGQTLPPMPFPDLKLSRGNARLVDIVYKAGKYGISTDRLVNKLYEDDPHGGPSDAVRTVHSRICQLNKQLKSRGYRIQGEYTGVKGVNGQYALKKLVPTPQEAVDLIDFALVAARGNNHRV